MSTKAQPWKAAWPPVEQKTTDVGIEYGVEKGQTVVVDGTAANVKPAKTQSKKVAWSPTEQVTSEGIGKSGAAVIDGTVANVKPAKK
jgi:hypothetical protein